VGGNPRPGIRDFDLDLTCRAQWTGRQPAGAERDLSCTVHCLESVDTEIEQHLLELLWIPEERGQILRKFEPHRHPRRAPLIAHQVPGPVHQVMEIETAQMRLRPAGHRQELADKPANAFYLCHNDREELAIFLGQRLPLQELLCPALDDIERRANLVGQTGGHAAQDGQLFGMT